MRSDRELLGELGSETNRDYPLSILSKSSSGDIREGIKSSSSPHTFPPESGAGVRKRAKKPAEYIEKLGTKTSPPSFDENWLGLFGIQEIIRSEIREIIRSEFHQLPETHLVQNLRHPSYHLRQPIPILIEKTYGAVTATYNDIELCGTGGSVKAAVSDLCAKIVARYEELAESPAKSQEYSFLKRIIEEVEPPAWQELKQLYREKLEEIPYVQAGYVKIDGNNAEVVIVLSEESVEIIMELAQIDMEINQEFRSLSFSVEYESSEDYLELDDFECFY